MSTFAKGNPFPFFSGTPFFGTPCFLFFFLSPAKVGSLEMQPGAKLQAQLGVSILQPHASTSVLDFESLDGRVLGASQVEYKPFGKPPLKREAAPRPRRRAARPCDTPALKDERRQLGAPGVLHDAGAASSAQSTHYTNSRTEAPAAWLAFLVGFWLA